MVSKLATFRTDSDIWDSFQAKAKSKGTHASALLQRFIRDYLDDNLDNRLDSAAPPDVDIHEMITNLRGSIDSELREIKHDMSGLMSERIETTTQLVENLRERIETLEAIATAKKPLLQIAREKVLAA